MQRPLIAGVLLSGALLLSSCSDGSSGLDETTPSTTTTPAPASESGDSERLCPADGLIGPDGQTYGRDPNQGCQFVDENGDIVDG